MRIARLLTLSAVTFATPAFTAPPAKPSMTKPAETKSPEPPSTSLEAETRAWHQKRVANLTAEDGWLSLVGLHWLEEGDNRLGSAADNDFIFPAGTPAHIGTLTRKGSQVTFTLQPGVTVTRGGQPFSGGTVGTREGPEDILGLGPLRFYLIPRGDKLGLRVKNPEAPARKQFHGIPTWPVSAAWRIEGRFEPAASPRKLAVPTVLGTVEDMNSPGTLVFQVNGQEYRLDPVLESESGPFFVIFGDQTNRTESYGAGRFLYVDPPKDGRVVLDFNRAYNPPCAFSPYATCPLPPAQNRLKLSVEAGEKRYGDH
ncbi:DUF1684 domain-containing protein [Melittangium boletus]|uniref:DUF1684 domain-containing protein n=1 Tax=Melittangium boletus DSM 14713 TaxID=1294270 RepID=A0A250IK78_9BACT|nr:DUF1684 domain-containing protein [Melittangium boletus]ATB31591.1 hypothetical protein MEBOL_005054 [Melittangium boletus DSM 14713]